MYVSRHGLTVMIGGYVPFAELVRKYMGVSKNRGTPKWMVDFMENPMKNGGFGGTTIFGNTHIVMLGEL